MRRARQAVEESLLTPCAKALVQDAGDFKRRPRRQLLSSFAREADEGAGAEPPIKEVWEMGHGVRSSAEKTPSAEKSGVARLLLLVEKQQVQIDLLHRGYEAIREESDALRDCLEGSGRLGRDQFLAQIHRRRFAKVVQQHPCPWDATPQQVMQMSELFRNTMKCAGFRTARQCSASSKALWAGTDLLPSPRLYAIGGSDGAQALSTCERFVEKANKWESLPPMPTPRSNLAALACEGRLYAIGGTDGVQVLGTVELYDEETNSWRSLPPMPTPRSGMAAVACGGCLYVVGGREGFQSLGTAERFDPSDGRWEVLPPMRSRRRFLAAACLSNKIYAVGGEDDGFAALRTMELFSHELGRWESGPPMPTRRRGLAAVALRGKLYAIGGGHAAQTPSLALDCVERYDAGNNRWESLPPMPTPRSFLAAVALGGSGSSSGRLYAIGGSGGAQAPGGSRPGSPRRSSQALRTVECFDEEANGWESFLPMPTRRGFFSAAVLRD